MSGHLLGLCYGAFVLLLVMAAISDVATFTIPNALCVALVLLFLVTAALSPMPVAWGDHIGAAGMMFAAGLIAFHLGLFGGGDIKLWAAAALWLGFDLLAPQIVLALVFGGILAMLLLVARFGIARLAGPVPSRARVPRVLTANAPVPYAIPIVFSTLLVSPREGFLP